MRSLQNGSGNGPSDPATCRVDFSRKFRNEVGQLEKTNVLPKIARRDKIVKKRDEKRFFKCVKNEAAKNFEQCFH